MPNKIRDLTGQRFGRLIVLEMTNQRQNKGVVWKCRCDCGNEIIARSGHLLDGNKSSCGCLKREQSSERMKQRTGSKNSRWVYDRESLHERRERNLIESRSLSRQCFERDGFACQLCGSKNRLNAHHLYSWVSNPEKRYLLDNVITLCEDHHIDFHRVYGRGQNTPKQFYEYAGVI